LFKLNGEHIQNVRNNKCLDVTGGRDAEAQNVQVYGKHNGLNQRWTILYEEDKDDVKTKGMGEFGFKINEPFFIVSRLPMKRVAEAIGASNVVIKRLVINRLAQQFFFDQVSKTVKSMQWKNRSLQLSGNNLIISPTNSRWF